ncbi:MAG TPA: hypothetical protein VMB48_17005 [Steroidobacteraceae bacterium]|nr:hypothetical protein [Steroidobacteraceae bacterium]
MKPLSRKTLLELDALQRALRERAEARNTALRMFAASRRAATPEAQREFWLEFSLLDQEYRLSVHRLAQFCARHNSRGPAATQPA